MVDGADRVGTVVIEATTAAKLPGEFAKQCTSQRIEWVRWLVVFNGCQVMDGKFVGG
jgi:hypothetical protein